MRLTALLLAFAFIGTLSAQKAPFKYGKISAEELKTNICPIDTNAEAYFIGDYGSTYFDLMSGRLIFQRHYRIKILNKTGYDWAMQKIHIRGGKRAASESLTTFKAVTYNLEDGKVVKSEAKSNSKAKETINEYWESFNIAMPNVREGSIIEVKYEIYSSSYAIRDWFFQFSIPVIESSYTVSIPEYFHYKNLSKGYESIDFKTTQSATNLNGLSYNIENKTFTAKNLPALKEEPYISCIDNYRACIDFELGSYQFPGGMLQNFNVSYEKINEELLKSENFYLQTKAIFFLTDTIKQIKAKFHTPEEQMHAAYTFVQRGMKWDKRSRMYVTESIRKAFKEQSGSSADINMLLVYMLKELGLKAEPVILSTRSNGMLFPALPMITAFNYTIAKVELNGKSILLDATDKYCPAGMLPPRCLNDEGRAIFEPNGAWVKLNTGHWFRETQLLNLTLLENGDLTGSHDIQSRDYAALNFRNNYSDHTSKDEYIKSLENSITGLKINELEIENFDSISKPVSRKLGIDLTSSTDIQGDAIYFYPMLFEKLASNPFKLKDRKFPVDYNYPTDENFICSIQIPENYFVEELPKPVVISLPENGGRYIFNIQTNENKITITSRLTLNKKMYLANEYNYIKEFYNQLVAKHAEMVIVKKKS